MVTQVARRMGYDEHSPIESAADIFREHAALSAFENDGARDFDLGALATYRRRGVRRAGAGAHGRCAQGEPAEDTRFFADGGFFTPDRKARFIAPEFLRCATALARISLSSSTPAACATSGTP